MDSIYIYIYISCHATSTDFPDPLSSPDSIVHRSRQVFQATSCIGTELLYVLAVQAFAGRVLMGFLVDELLLPW